MSNIKSKRGRLRSLLLCCAFCAVFLTGFVAGAGAIACYLFLQPFAVPVFRDANAVPVFYLRDEFDRPESGAPGRETASNKFYSVHSDGEADDVIHFRSSPPPGTEPLAASPMPPPLLLHDVMESPRAIEIQRNLGFRVGPKTVATDSVPADEQAAEVAPGSASEPAPDGLRGLIYSPDEKENAAIQRKRAAQASERRGANAPARDQRHKELIYSSENFKQIKDVWERIWFQDNPDFYTP